MILQTVRTVAVVGLSPNPERASHRVTAVRLSLGRFTTEQDLRRGATALAAARARRA